MFPEVVKGFIILALIFVPLERIFSLHSQKIFRESWGTDTIYFFIGYFIGRAGIALSIFLTFSLMGKLINPELQTKIASQPVGLQLLEAIIIADLGYYFAHRLLHTVPWLWQFHSVHHSIQQMDWLAAVRVHPCDQILTKLCQIIPLYLLGFSPEMFAVYAIFSAAIAFFIHSNIRLKFGLLKWIIATPEFHHWHHINEPKYYQKNFAAQLPWLDIIFGTLYMPVKKVPNKYGVPELIPTGYIGQLLYPFTRIMQMKNKQSSPLSKNLIRPLPLILLLGIVGVSSLTIGAFVNHMNLPSFIHSLSTKQVTVAELQQGKLKSPLILIDVRTPEEYSEDHIAKSLLVPLNDIEKGTGIKQVQNLAKLNTKPNLPKPTIVLYCTRGPRSIKAYKLLEKTGLNLVVLKGGIQAWREAIPPEKDQEILGFANGITFLPRK